MKRCGYEWTDVGDDLHECGEHGNHTEHACSSDGCNERVPADVRGGRAMKRRKGGVR